MTDANPAVDRSADTHDDGDSLRSSLAAAFETDTPEPAAPEPATDAEENPQVSDEGPAVTDKREAAPEGDEAADDRKDEGTDEIEAPATWSLADQETFRKQTPEAREFLTRRYNDMVADYTRKNQAIAPLRQQAERWQPYLQQIGAKPEEAWDALMRTEYTLRMGTPEARRDAWMKLAKQYNIDLPQGGGQAPAQQEQAAPLDPTVKALQDQIKQISGTLTQAQQREYSRAQQEHAAYQTRIVTEIEAFREAKTEAGKPAHPYFDEVQDHMAALVRAAKASGDPVPSLPELYDAAVWATPAVRQKLLADQRKASEREQEKERRKKASQASQAAGSLAPSATGGAVSADMDLRTMLERQFAGDVRI